MKGIATNQSMPGTIVPALILISLSLLCGCVSMAPVNSSFESAKTLAKGQVEGIVNYSPYYLRYEDDMGDKTTDKVNNNIGFKLGYGITDRLDLKFRYVRMIPVLDIDKEILNGINYFALSPRYGIMQDHISAGIDVGLYTYTLLEDDSSDQSFFISPKFAFTYPSGDKFDLTLSTKIDIFPWDDEVLWGINLGFGISSDLDKWAVRPEFGLMKDLGDFSYSTYLTWGVGVIVRFNAGNQADQ